MMLCESPNESLAAEIALRPVFARGQRRLVVDPGLVFRGHRYLDDLGARFAFEHAMAYLRRLDDPIAGFEPKRLTLVLVNDLDASRNTADHLKVDLVIMIATITRPRATGSSRNKPFPAPAIFDGPMW